MALPAAAAAPDSAPPPPPPRPPPHRPLIPPIVRHHEDAGFSLLLLTAPQELGNGCIIFDAGHSFAKVGTSDGEACSIHDARLGRLIPSHPDFLSTGVPPGFGAQMGVYIPQEIVRWQKYLRVLRPMQRGEPINMELRRAAEEHPLLFVERPGITLAERKAFMGILFEAFGTPAFMPVPEPTLAMLASGRTSGLALCSGASATYIVPVYEGHALMHAATRFPLAGSHVTDALLATLAALTPPLSEAAAQALKHIAALVSLDYAQANAAPPPTQHFTIPASPVEAARDITLQGIDRMACAEILFQPSLAALSIPGLHAAVKEAIGLCDPELQSTMWDNIVLAGGNTMLPGFVDRLGIELRRLAPRGANVRVIASPERHMMGWQGGAVLLSLPQSANMWITREVYDDDGPDKALRCLTW